uniref:Uncharacterized protein n=1 Tax=Arundo donax TaxID=35708 RepID=A0A0A9D391_ARUDO
MPGAGSAAASGQAQAGASQLGVGGGPRGGGGGAAEAAERSRQRGQLRAAQHQRVRPEEDVQERAGEAPDEIPLLATTAAGRRREASWLRRRGSGFRSGGADGAAQEGGDRWGWCHRGRGSGKGGPIRAESRELAQGGLWVRLVPRRAA